MRGTIVLMDPAGELADVAVVGAGPAGAATALRLLQLRPDLRVLLLDAAEFPRDKVCGDGVAPHAIALLDALEVPGVTELGPPVWGLRVRSPGGRAVAARCERPNRVIPRAVLDAVLVDAAVARGAVLHRHRVRRLAVHADRVVLDGEIAARVVVGADGARSVVRRALGAPPTPAAATAIAVRGYASTCVDPEALIVAFARARPAAYAWSFPLPGGGANVGYGIAGPTGPTSKRALLDRLAAELPGTDPDPATVRGHHLPLSTGPRFQPDGRVLLVGDAAALVNPVTGEGIFYGIASGALAARAALLGAGAGAAHRAALRRVLGRHHRHVGALARAVPHARFVDAAVAAAGRDRRVFDAIVEVGLGPGTVSGRVLAAVVADYLRLSRG
jgi:geranylgeranyl reductase family protein